VNINATLLGQAIWFGVFIWITMKYVWPPLQKAMADRQKQIAEGLAASERGKLEQELAAKRSADVIREAKEQANDIVGQAEKRGQKIVEDAKEAAKSEAARIVASAKGDIDQEVMRAKEHLRERLADLAVAGAAKILRREVDAKAHSDLLGQLRREL